MRKKIAVLMSLAVLFAMHPFVKSYAADNADDYETILTKMVTEYKAQEREVYIDTESGTVAGNSKDIVIRMENADIDMYSADEVSEMLEDEGYSVNIDDDIVTAISDFSFGRIYVDSSNVKNTYGAVLVAAGEHTVLQYKSPEAASSAYYKLLKDGYDASPSYTITLEEDTNEYVIGTESIDGEYIDNGIQFHGIGKMQEDEKYKKRSVKVAVLDTGINDYFNRSITYYNFNGSETDKDTNGHGTKVASIIADCTSDNVSFISMKVFDDDNKSDMAALEAALLKCEDIGVDAVNISIGIYDKNFEKKCGTLGYLDTEFEKLTEQKTAICVSAGNERVHTDYVYPAGSKYTWTVGAIDTEKQAASFSNHGKIDFTAKGVDVIVKNVNNKKAVTSGTSFACPYITGIAANYKGSSDYDTNTLYDMISKTCVDLGDTGKDEIYGYGYPVYGHGEGIECTHANKKTVISLATCTKEGSRAVVCRDCGKVLNETSTAPLGHNYKETERTEETCILKGTVTYVCIRCKEKYTEDTEVSPDNHKNITEKIIKEPTCEEEGKKREYCNDCNTFIGNFTSIPKKEHTWEIVKTVDGTCAASGYSLEKCSVCGVEKQTEKSLNPENHTNIDKRVSQPATCDKDGILETYCRDCDKIISTEKIAAAGHKYEVKTKTEPTCTSDGKVVYRCLACGDEYEEYVSKTGHDYKLTKSVDGTCAKKGYGIYTCSKCGNEKITATTYGITHDTYTEKKAADCENDGYVKEICKNCGKVINETVISKKGHTKVTKNGVEKCSVCGKVFKVYEYKIIFNTAGGTVNTKSYSGKYGDVITLPSASRRGYSFTGWSDGKNTYTSTYKITGNCKLIAVWKKNTYTITVKNGSDCIKKKVVYGSSVVLSYKPRRGYDFAGWYIDEKRIGSKFTYKYVANKTVTAKYKKCYVTSPTIKYKSSSKIILNPVKNATIYQVYISDTKTITKKYHKLYTCNNHIIRLSGFKNKRYAIVRCGKKDSTGRYVYSKWKAYRIR